MFRIVKQLWRRSGAANPEGQTLVEYALMLVMVAIAVIGVLALFGDDLAAAFSGILGGDAGSGNGDGQNLITVTVVDSTSNGLSGVRVFAYAEDGTYLDQYGDTDDQGQAQFQLPDAHYQFATQYQLVWFWSPVINAPTQKSAQIETESSAFNVWVRSVDGDGQPDIPVYVYSADDDYVGVEGATDPNGRLQLSLAPGSVKFRADFGEQVYWSELVPVADGEATVVVNDCRDGEFIGEYFANQNLSGTPAFTRCDGNISFDWGRGTPSGNLNNDEFSIRWTGRINFPEAGTYRFSTNTDDGVRLWVDDQQLIDAWGSDGRNSGRIELAAGFHEVVMTYFEDSGDAIAILTWEQTTADCPDGQFLAEYFNNRDLEGEPTVVRCEEEIDYDWDNGSPASGIDKNNFSARWTGRFAFNADSYEFSAHADNGARLYVDGQEIFNGWVTNPNNNNWSGRKTLSEGTHEVRLEYYEAGGDADVRLDWAAVLSSCPTGEFLAEYFDNANMQGDPVFSRCESNISYNWGADSPHSLLDDNRFSVRWSGDFEFSRGWYTFRSATDDGVQVWVDDELVISAWYNQTASVTQQERVRLEAGTHRVVVYYFEWYGLAAAQVNWE